MSRAVLLTPSPLRADEDIVATIFDAPDPLRFPDVAARWLYTSRDNQTMPQGVFAALDAFRIATKDTLGADGMQAMAKYDALVRADMVGFARRRQAEQELATYIKEQVLPIAPFHERARLATISANLGACRTSGEHGITINFAGELTGKQMRWSSKCGLAKMCPDESRVEGRRVAERYLPPTQQWLKDAPPGVRRRAYYAVLTEPNYPIGELAHGKVASFKRFTDMQERIRHTKSTRDRIGDVQGALLVQEDPMSGLGDWNGHLNAIFLVEGHFDYEELRAEWGYNLEIKEIKPYNLAEAFLEICKYQCKAVSMGEKKDGTTQPGMVEFPPTAWLEWWRANSGFRRTRSYGVLHGIPKPAKKTCLDRLVWLGRVQWKGSSYRVEHYDSALQFVDLIQGDKSGILAPRVPKKKRRKRGLSPPSGANQIGGTLSMLANASSGS